jgi:hypothetical protein
MESVFEVGEKLVALANQGRWLDAIHSLYSPEIISIEAGAPPGKSPQCTGLAAVIAKTDWFMANHDIHSSEVRGPFPHDDRLIVFFKLDLTAKAGAMAGKRFNLEEAALYTVMDGKIVKEEFFYHMPG